MADIDVDTPQGSRNSKIQLENQQFPRHADFRDANWSEIHYPGRFRLRPYSSASIFEYVFGALFLILGLIVIGRMFFVSDENKTVADVLSVYLFFGIAGIISLVASVYLIARAIRAAWQSRIYILPNGFPINIRTVLNDYRDAPDMLVDKVGYFDVERARASNPIVAPGEITYTFSPQNTYAPSNVARPEGENPNSDMLKELLHIDEETEDSQLPELVGFFEHIDSREDGHVILGIDENEQLIQVPIMQLFHHLVGGMSGSGKSVYLRALVYQLMREADDSDTPLKLGLADIENNTFPEFRGCRHIDWYASNYVEIEEMTTELLREVERRKTLYEQLTSTPKDIERYNVLARREGIEEIPIYVVLYDEFSALMHRSQAQHKRILSDILQLALRARKYGIFLIIAGQSFKSDLIDSSVLGQFSIATAFKVRTGTASLSIIGQVGAEKLKHPGEALVKAKDGTISHFQGLYVDDDTLLDRLEEFRDPNSRYAVPQAVQQIINFSHEQMGDVVRFKDLEKYMREQGHTRADVMRHIEWMEEHNFIIRGTKNARVLNWNKIRGEE